jgi:hypothetical protein
MLSPKSDAISRHPSTGSGRTGKSLKFLKKPFVLSPSSSRQACRSTNTTPNDHQLFTPAKVHGYALLFQDAPTTEVTAFASFELLCGRVLCCWLRGFAPPFPPLDLLSIASYRSLKPDPIGRRSLCRGSFCV